MHFFVFHGKVYAYRDDKDEAYVMQDNGWANPVYWTWTVITKKDYQVIQELAEREHERFQKMIEDDACV